MFEFDGTCAGGTQFDDIPAGHLGELSFPSCRTQPAFCIALRARSSKYAARRSACSASCSVISAACARHSMYSGAGDFVTAWLLIATRSCSSASSSRTVASRSRSSAMRSRRSAMRSRSSASASRSSAMRSRSPAIRSGGPVATSSGTSDRGPASQPLSRVVQPPLTVAARRRRALWTRD